jgi:hypothetical protein
MNEPVVLKRTTGFFYWQRVIAMLHAVVISLTSLKADKIKVCPSLIEMLFHHASVPDF